MIKNYYWPEAISRISTPFYRLLRIVDRQSILVAYYHVVSDCSVPHIKHAHEFRTIEEFRKDLDFFANEYESVSLGEIISHTKTGKSLPHNAVHITFDDGLREFYEHALPLLNEFEMKTTLFVNSAFVDNQDMSFRYKVSLLLEKLRHIDNARSQAKIVSILQSNGVSGVNFQKMLLNVHFAQKLILDEIADAIGFSFTDYLSNVKPYMTKNEIRSTMNHGHAIGAHSAEHPLYSELTLQEQLWQTKECVTYLQRHFDLEDIAFSFPFNDNGVSKEFFHLLLSECGVGLSFGTGSLRQDCIATNFHRCSMETRLPTKQRLSNVYIQKLARILVRQNHILRN